MYYNQNQRKNKQSNYIIYLHSYKTNWFVHVSKNSINLLQSTGIQNRKIKEKMRRPFDWRNKKIIFRERRETECLG